VLAKIAYKIGLVIRKAAHHKQTLTVIIKKTKICLWNPK